MTIKPIIDTFLRSEYFADWQSENIDAGGYSRNSDRRDRYVRCQDAASNGADGSTHREVIQDMRRAFSDWLSDRRRASKLHFAEYPYRLETAAHAHFAELEQWHITNGSIDQEVG